MNIGVGTDLAIKELEVTVQGVDDFEGGLEFDTTKPGGTQRKVIDLRRRAGLSWCEWVQSQLEHAQDYFVFITSVTALTSQTDHRATVLLIAPPPKVPFDSDADKTINRETRYDKDDSILVAIFYKVSCVKITYSL